MSRSRYPVLRRRRGSIVSTALAFAVVLAAAFVGIPSSADAQIVSNGNLDTLPLGTNPDCGTPAGAWSWPPGYITNALCETNPGEFRIVPTALFQSGGIGNSLAVELNTTAPLHLPNVFNQQLFSLPGDTIRVRFDIWVPTPGIGGPSIYVGGDNGGGGFSNLTDRGPQLQWLANGNIAYTDDLARQINLVNSSPFNLWQHVLLSIDLSAGRYDFSWGVGAGQPILIAQRLPFRSGALAMLDRFTIAHFGDIVAARAYVDNLSVTRSSDCNSNGLPDEDDIAAGRSMDCDANGWPDECGARLGRFILLHNLINAELPSTLVAFNPPTAPVQAPVVGVLPPTGNDRGMTLGPTPNTVFTVDVQNLRLHLFRVGPGGGLIRSVPLDRTILELAYDPTAQTLYGTTDNQLFLIDTLTGRSSFVMNLPGAGSWVALSYDYCTGQLVGSGDTGQTLFFVDPVAQTSRALQNPIGITVNDVAADPLDGVIYGISDGGLLVSIDRVTGRNTFAATVTGIFETPSGIAITSGDDCNGNSFPDACDIAAGRNEDANSDGVPDDCVVNCGCTLPTISLQPTSSQVCAGDPVMLTIAASGTPAPGVQWRFQGVGIPGATNPTLILTNTVPTNSGTYDVEVSNACGSVISDAAAVVVWPSASADINGDGLVDGLDIALFVEVLRNRPNGPAELGYCAADLNGDGVVNFSDLSLFIANLMS